MNILVLGNGFDIAHGFKTFYKNFLEAVEITNKLIDLDKAPRNELWSKYNKSNLPKSLCVMLDKIAETKTFETYELTSFHTFWKNNFWFKYFSTKPDGTWIDFERDIKEVCQYLENKIYNSGAIRKLNEKIEVNTEFSDYINFLMNYDKIDTFEKLIERLEEDLRHVTNSLDIYIGSYVNGEVCDILSPNVIKSEIDKVISFNYSHTFERLYDYYNNIEIDYVHGEAGYGRLREYSNLVLGYDESEDKIKDDMITTFAPFKKYYQRVLKGAGHQYALWIKEIQDDPTKKHNVYFFGHSMDVTDKDIIQALILNKNVKTTIYYYSKKDKIDKVKNTIKVLGYQKFSEYTNLGDIIFEQQADFQGKESTGDYECKMAIKYLINLPMLSQDEYKGLCKWFSKIQENPYQFHIKYYYLAIDILQKLHLEPEKVADLVNACNQYFGNEAYSYEEFLEDYAIFNGTDADFNNDELHNLINTLYAKQVKNNGWYRTFLESINYDGRRLRAIYMGNENLIIDKVNLKIAVDCFLDFFDSSITNIQLYDDMVKFLKLIEEVKVQEVLAEYEKEQGIIKNRINTLTMKYH